MRAIEPRCVSLSGIFGQEGGEAIAEILSGATDPSGRLPVTFPMSEAQLPHPKIEGDPNGAPIGPVGRSGHYGAIFTASYDEGAAVGYKLFFNRAEQPLFPFGFGLSYTRFELSNLVVNVSGATVTASATVRNSGARDGQRRRSSICLALMGQSASCALSIGIGSTSRPPKKRG